MDNQVDTAFDTLDEATFDALMGDGTSSAPTIPVKPIESSEEVPAKVEVKEDETTEPEKTQEEIDKEIDGASLEGETTNNTISGDSDVDLAEFFKAKAQGLIDRGIWQDFDGIEDFEWNEESYGTLAQQQAEWKAEDLYEERVAKVGDVGKAILEYAEHGGNPSEIIDLFKASRKIEDFDITTDNGKEEVVKEYYTKIVGWSNAKANKYVKSLVDSDDDSLTQEATEAKELMEQGVQEQIKEAQENQKRVQAHKQEQAKAWEQSMTKVIQNRQDLSQKEKRDIHKALLTYDQKLQDGRTVNTFMLEFMKIQQDPQKYIDLVRYVTNPDKYLEKVEKKVETEVAKKNWNLIKGNTSLSKATGTSHSTLKEKPKSDLVIDYKKLI